MVTTQPAESPTQCESQQQPTVQQLVEMRAKEIRQLLAESRSARLWRRRDPELLKALGRIDAALEELLRLMELSRINAAAQYRVKRLLRFEPRRLRLDCSLELMDELDQILIQYGDITYLAMDLESEYHRDPGTDLNWTDVHKEKRFDLYGADLKESDAYVIKARRHLASFRRCRSDHYRRHRARQRWKVRCLWLVALLLFLLVATFTVLIGHQLGNQYGTAWLVTIAGATGAAIGGTYKLRDVLVRGSELREFRPAIIVQLLLGAAAALFVFLILSSRIVEIGDTTTAWAQQGAVAFVVGFSEPTFLGLVRKVSAPLTTGGGRPNIG